MGRTVECIFMGPCSLGWAFGQTDNDGNSREDMVRLSCSHVPITLPPMPPSYANNTLWRMFFYLGVCMHAH